MGAPGEDRISGLPDELLHCILVRLGSARDAVRAAVLSRRWRHVLGPLPELVLDGDLDAPMPMTPPLDEIDAALAACDAPVLKRLSIGIMRPIIGGRRLPVVRAAPWLRFASERVVDKLSVVLLPRPEVDNGVEAVLELPACEAVTAIHLILESTWRIRPPSAGLFRALTDLKIDCGSMDGSELTALVCTQCPCLVHLNLSLMLLVNASKVSIRSDSLQSLRFSVWQTHRLLQLFVRNRLKIVAPRLEKLSLSTDIDEARISAPKLAELFWSGNIYDPRRHKFDGVGSHLRVLEPGRNASLMQQFEEVDELRLFLCIGQEIEDYESFLKETNNLPKCKILNISFAWTQHGFIPGMLHLLRSCNSTRKVSLFDGSDDYPLSYPCRLSCPCRSEESHRIDDIYLSSLEEVEITSYTSSPEVLEFVEQLSRCNAAQLKKVVMKHRTRKMIDPAPPPTKEAREKICSIYQPNIEVEFYVFSDFEWVRLD